MRAFEQTHVIGALRGESPARRPRHLPLLLFEAHDEFSHITSLKMGCEVEIVAQGYM